MNTVEEKRQAREELLRVSEQVQKEYAALERGHTLTTDDEAIRRFALCAGEYVGAVLAYLRAEELAEGGGRPARLATATSKALFGYVLGLARESLTNAETHVGPSRLHWLVQARVHITEALVFAERYAS